MTMTNKGKDVRKKCIRKMHKCIKPALPVHLRCLLTSNPCYECVLVTTFLLFFSVASPEAQRRNSLEKQLEKLDNDMSSLSKISALADTLTITHMVNSLL